MSKDRIIFLPPSHQLVRDDLHEIFSKCKFLYDKERILENTLSEAFSEMVYVIHRFKTCHDSVLENGIPNLDKYINQLNSVRSENFSNLVIELQVYELSTYFKTTLILAKAVLDKLVPFYSYRFDENLRKFSNKGKKLLQCIRRNRKVTNHRAIIELIERAKVEWIDSLISLRDTYIHYSSLREYTNFWIPGAWIGNKKFSNISDFNLPTVRLHDTSKNALEYVLEVKQAMIAFIRDFLCLCEFTEQRRPKVYLKCENGHCRHEFAKRIKKGPNAGKLLLTSPNFKMEVKDRNVGYAVIVCPKCGEKTDTDLFFWRHEGFSFV